MATLTKFGITCIWATSDALLLCQYYVIKRANVPALRGIVRLDSNLKDADLGESVVRALQNVEVIDSKEITSEVKQLNAEYPDVDEWHNRHDRVGVTFYPEMDANNILFDGRVVRVNKANKSMLPVTSSAEEIGAYIRQILAALKAQRAMDVPKPKASRKISK